MGNNKIPQELKIKASKDSATTNNKTEKAREYLDYKEAPKYSVPTSDNTEKSNEDLVVPSAEKGKTTK